MNCVKDKSYLFLLSHNGNSGGGGSSGGKQRSDGSSTGCKQIELKIMSYCLVLLNFIYFFFSEKEIDDDVKDNGIVFDIDNIVCLMQPFS